MNHVPCTRFEGSGRRQTASAAEAAEWRRHLVTCRDCRAQERVDAVLREALGGAEPPVVGERFTGRIVARLAEPPARRKTFAAALLLLVYGGLCVSASASILAALPPPLFDAQSVRAIVLGGALLSPLLLIERLRRALARLVASC